MGSYKVSNNHLIYRRLIQLRKRPKDLCRILGITEQTLQIWINDPGRINLRALMIIAGFLKLDYDFLLFYLLRSKTIGKDKTGTEEKEFIKAIKEKNNKHSFID